MFHLLLCVTENIKQSHAVRGGRFRIEFQPNQGNLTHTYGNQVTHTTFPLSSPVRGPGYSPRQQSPTTLHSYVATKINPTSTKRVNGRSTRRSNQVLKLTDYHISRYVPHTATLAIFDYTSGVSQLHNSASCPYISAGI